MIGYLKGKVVLLEQDSLVVATGGIGYEVQPTLSAMAQALQVGDEVEMLIHTLVREDEIRLFGFSTREERKLFEMLTSISGVGPRSALIIISQLGEEGFVETVLTGNPAPLTRIKGIGKRTAERVLLEMKDRVAKLYAGGVPARLTPSSRLSSRLLEAQEALLGLGFRRPDISAALADLNQMKDGPVEEIIREALRRLRQ